MFKFKYEFPFLSLLVPGLLSPGYISAALAADQLVAAKSPVHKTEQASVHYLANEAIMVTDGDVKVLFDPLFHEHYQNYQLVPDAILSALFNNEAPYDNIDVIFISHAHGDHFSAVDVLQFLKVSPNTMLVAPDQAVEQIAKLAGAETVLKQMMPITLAYRDAPIQGSVGALDFDVVRIPHSGWPGRADVSNLVFRVSLSKQTTVIHMGDADADDNHFQPLAEHWNQRQANAAFPPYWFFLSSQGRLILSDRLGAVRNVGVHVPVSVPPALRQSGASYFSRPGQKIDLPEVKPQ